METENPPEPTTSLTNKDSAEKPQDSPAVLNQGEPTTEAAALASDQDQVEVKAAGMNAEKANGVKIAGEEATEDVDNTSSHDSISFSS